MVGRVAACGQKTIEVQEGVSHEQRHCMFAVQFPEPLKRFSSSSTIMQ